MGLDGHRAQSIYVSIYPAREVHGKPANCIAHQSQVHLFEVKGLPTWWEDGHRHQPRHDAAEEGDDKVEGGQEDQEHPVSSLEPIGTVG